MLTKRVIPCLDVKDGRVVKGVNFVSLRDAGDPANSSEVTKAQKPLAAAEVVVEEIPGNPGYYSSKFFLRPHYQLEGLTVSLRLVSKLPSQKQQ